MRKILFYSLILIGKFGFSQTKPLPFYTREFSVLSENDVFFFRDYYYSAGEDLVYKKLASSRTAFYKTIAKSDTSKVIFSYKSGIKLYTPREISQTETAKMDRPYAGYEYVGGGITRFDKLNRGFSFNIELGLVGKQTGLGQFQAWWHKILKLRTPRGWNYQINNEVIININYSHWKAWRLSRTFDLVSNTQIHAGTASNKVSEDLTLRFLNFNSLKESIYSGTLLSPRPIKNELFFFGGIGFDFVASNIFIEGSLLERGSSPFVADALPFIFRQRFGLMYTTRKWFYSSTIHHLSREVAGGIDHIYGSLDIGFRF